MHDQSVTNVLRAPEILTLSVDDALFGRAQEINNLIARRAYELFESGGFAHGHDLDDWLHAESEILLDVQVEIKENETEVTVCAEAPGFSENELEVRVEPPRIFIVGKRQETSEQPGKAERQAKHIFRVLDLPAPVNPTAVHATLRDGLLVVRLPKTESGKKIPILTRAASA